MDDITKPLTQIKQTTETFNLKQLQDQIKFLQDIIDRNTEARDRYIAQYNQAIIDNTLQVTPITTK